MKIKGKKMEPVKDTRYLHWSRGKLTIFFRTKNERVIECNSETKIIYGCAGPGSYYINGIQLPTAIGKQLARHLIKISDRVYLWDIYKIDNYWVKWDGKKNKVEWKKMK